VCSVLNKAGTKRKINVCEELWRALQLVLKQANFSLKSLHILLWLYGKRQRNNFLLNTRHWVTQAREIIGALDAAWWSKDVAKKSEKDDL